MNCEQVREYILRYVDHELESNLSDQVHQHLLSCPLCKLQVEKEKEFSVLIKDHIPKESAPFALREGVVHQIKKQGRLSFLTNLDWLRAIPRPALAGMLVMIIIGTFIFVPGKTFPVFAASISSHIEHLKGGYPVEIQSNNMSEVLKWFEGKLDFAVNIPDMTNEEVKLVGGRICHLKDKKVAYLMLEKDGHEISLFVLDARGIRLPKSKKIDGEHHMFFVKNSKGYQSVLCLNKKTKGVGCIFVSALPEEELIKLVI